MWYNTTLKLGYSPYTSDWCRVAGHLSKELQHELYRPLRDCTEPEVLYLDVSRSHGNPEVYCCVCLILHLINYMQDRFIKRNYNWGNSCLKGGINLIYFNKTQLPNHSSFLMSLYFPLTADVRFFWRHFPLPKSLHQVEWGIIYFCKRSICPKAPGRHREDGLFSLALIFFTSHAAFQQNFSWGKSSFNFKWHPNQKHFTNVCRGSLQHTELPNRQSSE